MESILTQLNRWKNQVLEDLPKLFSDERNALEVVCAGYEKQIQELYARETVNPIPMKKNPLDREKRSIRVD